MIEIAIIIAMGLVVGSFLGAYTFRWPKDISIIKPRSFCPRCKNTIAWFDNIPLISFVVLTGKCRQCKKKILPRYPIIEVFTALAFLLVYFSFINCNSLPLLSSGLICTLYGNSIFSFGFFIALTAILIGVFVIDFEHQLIPDELVFLGLALVVLFRILFFPSSVYLGILSGLAASLFLLIIHLITKGRGMGLGDVKLAFFGGTLFGFPYFIVWLLASFIIGGLTGLVLMALKKVKIKDRISFGPFLVISAFVVLFIGETIIKLAGF